MCKLYDWSNCLKKVLSGKKKFNLSRFCMTGIGIWIFSIAASAWGAEMNLLPRGSFESLDNWGGKKNFCTLDKEIFKEGNASVRIDMPGTNAPGYLYEYCPMKAGNTYKISLWYKTRKLFSTSGSLKLHLAFNLKNGKNGSAGQKIIPIPLPAGNDSVDWTYFSTEVTPPPGTYTCQLVLGFDGVVGTFWLDGITVIKEESSLSSVPKVTAPPNIDGRNDDACWKNAATLTGFFINEHEGKLASKQTRVQMAYDEKNFYFFICCDEPEIKKITAKRTGKDNTELWKDDSIEIFISPDPGRTYQFIINPTGSMYDSEIRADDQTAQGYRTNIKWDSSAHVKSLVEKKFWTVEMAVPIASMTPVPLMGETWKINFARGDIVSGVWSTWSRLIGAFHQPKYFSQIAFSDKDALITRVEKIKYTDPFTVNRPKPLYKELLTDKPGNYTAYMWDSTISKVYLPESIQKRFNDEQWKAEVIDMYQRKGEAGIGGTPLPWGVDNLTFDRTEKRCMEDYEKYGTRRKCCTESRAIQAAWKKGAELLRADPPLVSLIDPIYVDVIKEETMKVAKRFKNKSYLWTIEGLDEPYIYPILGKISEMGPKMTAWNREVTEKYGFGKYGMPAPDDPTYWQHPETHPFQQIAFARWYSDAYADTRKQVNESLKEIAPDIKYVGNTFWLMTGFVPFDYSVFGRYSDMLGGDPYASSAERREGRGIYNHGFGTKLLRDLGGKPTIAIVQAFSYAGYTPKPNDLREWVSQSLKTGAERIEYFEDGERYKNPPLYEEIMRTAKIITRMNKVNIPCDPDTAIVCSLDSEAALAANGDHIYTAYSILGEKNGSWFEFISDRQLERNEKDLSVYKIIYLPLGKYMPRPAMLKLVDYVKNGGTLVIGDPEAFSYHRDGSSLSDFREELTGTKLGKGTFTQTTLISTSKGPFQNKTYPFMKEDSIYAKIHLAHEIVPFSPSLKIIAKFPDGKPAVLENTVEKGKVIYFAANPFAPDIILMDSPISEFFHCIQTQSGAKTERPIWRFLLPKN